MAVGDVFDQIRHRAAVAVEDGNLRIILRNQRISVGISFLVIEALRVGQVAVVLAAFEEADAVFGVFGVGVFAASLGSGVFGVRPI